MKLAQLAEKRIRAIAGRALEGYDFETPVKAAIVPIIEKSSWVRAQDIEAEHTMGSGANIERILNDSNTRQMFTVFPDLLRGSQVSGMWWSR
jgi:hypothetical protein